MNAVTLVAPSGNGRLLGQTANASWAEALRVYRASVDLYHHAMALRSRREARMPSTQSGMSITPLTPAPSIPYRNGAAHELMSLCSLTLREREVARLLANGYTNQQIAEMLVLTRGTVANHVGHILAKLSVSNRTQVAAIVYRDGSSAG